MSEEIKLESPTGKPHGLAPVPLFAKGLLCRAESPQHYIGNDPLGVPRWSHYPLHAIPIDADKVQGLLDEIGRFEPSVRAIIYPACQLTLPSWANDES